MAEDGASARAVQALKELQSASKGKGVGGKAAGKGKPFAKGKGVEKGKSMEAVKGVASLRMVQR